MRSPCRARSTCSSSFDDAHCTVLLRLAEGGSRRRTGGGIALQLHRMPAPDGFAVRRRRLLRSGAGAHVRNLEGAISARSKDAGCAFTSAPVADRRCTGKRRTTRGDMASRLARSPIRISQSPYARCSSAAGTTGFPSARIFRASLRAATVRLAGELLDLGAGECVDAFVLGMARMSLHPAPRDRVAREQRIEFAP